MFFCHHFILKLKYFYIYIVGKNRIFIDITKNQENNAILLQQSNTIKTFNEINLHRIVIFENSY